MVSTKKKILITDTTTMEKILIEKRIYDALKPFFKTDIKPEDIGLIWDIFDNAKIYGMYAGRPLPIAVDSSGRLRVVTT